MAEASDLDNATKQDIDNIRQNASTMGTTLCYAHMRLGDHGARLLSEALKENTVIESIDLRSNNIGDDGAAAVSGALKENTTLQTIDLGSNIIGKDGIHALINAVEKCNYTLTRLNLSNNPEWDIESVGGRIAELEARNQDVRKAPQPESDRILEDPDIEEAIQHSTKKLIKKYGNMPIRSKVLEQVIFPRMRSIWKEEQEKVTGSTTDEQRQAAQRIKEELGRLQKCLSAVKDNRKQTLLPWFYVEVRNVTDQVEEAISKGSDVESVVREFGAKIHAMDNEEKAPEDDEDDRYRELFKTVFGEDLEKSKADLKESNRRVSELPKKDTPNTRLQRDTMDDQFWTKVEKAFPRHVKMYDANLSEPRSYHVDISCSCNESIEDDEKSVEITHGPNTWTLHLCHSKPRFTACGLCEEKEPGFPGDVHTDENLRIGSPLYHDRRGITCSLTLEKMYVLP